MGEFVKMEKKISIAQICTIIIFLITYIIYFFLGIVGEHVLVGVFVRNLGIFIVALYLLGYLLKKYKSSERETPKLLILAILTLILGVFSALGEVNVIRDYQDGTKTITLSQCHVEKRSGIKGILQFHYYLVGIDEQGKKHSLEIDFKSRDELVNKSQVMIEYYENINRIVDYN